MTAFLVVALGVLALVFVTYPLFRKTPLSADPVEDGRLQVLQSKRDTLYSALEELRFDLESGTLTDDEHRDLEARYRTMAVSVLKDIDNLDESTEVEEEIEKQVMELRQDKGRLCPSCGARHTVEDRFCSHCGTSLDQGSAS